MTTKYATEKTVSKVWGKSYFQEIRKTLISQGFNVEKINGGYELRLPKGELLLKAMNGSNGYLVRHVHNLFA